MLASMKQDLTEKASAAARRPVSARNDHLWRSGQPCDEAGQHEPQPEMLPLLGIDSRSRSAIEKSLVLPRGTLSRRADKTSSIGTAAVALTLEDWDRTAVGEGLVLERGTSLGRAYHPPSGLSSQPSRSATIDHSKGATG